jgi:predicted RNase H-like nuclease (RuvC/YqgF family)
MSLVKLVNEEMGSEMKSYQSELDLISNSITDVNHRLERLYDAIETGKLGLDDLACRIRELRTRQEQLHSRRIEIENQMTDRRVESTDLETISGYIDDLHGILGEGSLAILQLVNKFSTRGVKVLSHQEPWTEAPGEIGELLYALTG